MSISNSDICSIYDKADIMHLYSKLITYLNNIDTYIGKYYIDNKYIILITLVIIGYIYLICVIQFIKYIVESIIKYIQNTNKITDNYILSLIHETDKCKSEISEIKNNILKITTAVFPVSNTENLEKKYRDNRLDNDLLNKNEENV